MEIFPIFGLNTEDRQSDLDVEALYLQLCIFFTQLLNDFFIAFEKLVYFERPTI